MGVLKYFGDNLESDSFNLVNTVVVLAAAAGSGFATHDVLTDEMDNGTENRDQAVIELTQEVDSLKSFTQIYDIEKQQNILKAERGLDEAKNGEWAELSDQSKAYAYAQNKLELDADFAQKAFQKIAQPVAESLTFNADIAERDYASLRGQMVETLSDNNTRIPMSVAAASLNECQVSNVHAETMSLSKQFDTVQSCMKGEEGGNKGYTLFGAAGGFLFTTIFLVDLLGAGLNGLDRSIDRGIRRRKSKKLEN